MKKVISLICFVFVCNTTQAQNNNQTKKILDIVFGKYQCKNDLITIPDTVSAINFKIYGIWIDHSDKSIDEITRETKEARRTIYFILDVDKEKAKIFLNLGPNDWKVHKSSINPILAKNTLWFTKKDDITSFYDVKPDKQELILNAMYTYFEKK